MQSRAHLFRAALALCLLIFAGSAHTQNKLLTVAESSGFTATSTHAEVLDFIHALQKQVNGSMLRIEHLCTSTEGRFVPMLVIGDPAPAAPRDLRHDTRGVVYIQANIHAGEVEGKEACLMLIRDILTAREKPLLKDLILIIVPNFNPDGNDRISTQNRTRQAGPEKGVGIRYNAQNLDLNRDAMKVESPEMRGLITRVMNTWDPFLLVDCHTTNGSYHIQPVTYVWALNPNTGTSLQAYMRDIMMPSIQKTLKKDHNVLSIPYGNFMSFSEPEKGWSPAGPEPRYLTNYTGLRNRMAILNENYAYADYKDRVLGCYYFLQEILEYCAANLKPIQAMVKKADQETVIKGLRAGETDSLMIEYTLLPADKKIEIVGYEMKIEPREGGRPHVTRTDKQKKYTVPFFCNYVSKRSIRYPGGYFIEVQDPDVIDLLLTHGIVTERLTAPATVTVEAFRIEELKSAERAYQGHHMNSVRGSYETVEKTFPKGTLYVSTAQPLGTLAACLLEAESDDGLVVWNMLDRYLVAQWRSQYLDYPVYRLLEPVNLAKRTLAKK